MSEREAYEACLIELNKVKAPALLLKDFVYLFNKGIQQYVNKKYNLFELNQQATDDLRVLTNSIKITKANGLSLHEDEGETETFEASFDCELPKDYLHILNCICEFKDKGPSRCASKCRMLRVGANKLDTNQWSSVITNYYMRPSIKRPYYYIINIKGSGDPEEYQAYPNDDDKESGTRYGNISKPMMQIKYGNELDRYELTAVYVDYLRAPKYFKLTEEELNNAIDTTEKLEFPDYVVYEVINEIVKLVMENASDARMQSFIPINQSIAGPATK